MTTSLSDRLRGVIGPRRTGAPGTGASIPVDPAQGALSDSRRADQDPPYADATADVLDGQWHERGGERFLVVDRTYVPGYRHGSMVLADGLPPSNGVWPRLSLLANASCGRAHQLLFVDLETTGIAGGAGTYAFLVGCAWFTGGTLRTRQLFLSSFAAERGLLAAVADIAAAAGTVVTYNGKSFDMPVMENRFAMHRMETPFAELPHIDMLHPARRMWRESRHVQKDVPYENQRDVPYAGCRLSTLEQTLCGYVREGDVAGFEIPARYFHYVHTGDARPLAGVFEHNRLDLLSLALVTSRAAQLLEDGAPAARTGREALGMGWLYERGGLMTEARACFARAAEMGDEDVAVDALRAYAVISRRMRRYDDAAAAWHRVLAASACTRPVVREASEALAVHLEHRRRDPRSARRFALQLLQVDDTSPRRQAAEYRLARIDRKLEFESRQPSFAF